MLWLHSCKLLIPNIPNKPLNLLLQHPLQQLFHLPLPFHCLTRNVLNNHREVILGEIMQIQHAVNIVLILPINDEEDHRTDHHYEVQHIHDLVIVGIAGLAELYR